jgi:hypothetical protein
MSKTSDKIILGTMLVGLVGAAAFLFSRGAAAKDKAAQAFAVDMDCGSFLVLDEAKARSAFVAAAIAVAPSPDSSAIEALKQILAFMFDQCDWNDPPDGRTFVRGTGQYLTWKMIEDAVGDKTVAGLKEFLSDIGVMQGSSPSEPYPWLVSEIFGTGGCMDCAMGTGGETQSKQGYHLASDLAKGRKGTGYLPKKPPAIKRPLWMPVGWRGLPKPMFWVMLDSLVQGNIYIGRVFTKGDKFGDTSSEPLQVEVRNLSDGSQEARVL